MALAQPALSRSVTAPVAVATADTLMTPNILKQGMILELSSNLLCYVDFGQPATATTGYPVPPGNIPVRIKVPTRSSGVNSTYPGQETPAAGDQSQLHAIAPVACNLSVTIFTEN